MNANCKNCNKTFEGMDPIQLTECPDCKGKVEWDRTTAEYWQKVKITVIDDLYRPSRELAIISGLLATLALFFMVIAALPLINTPFDKKHLIYFFILLLFILPIFIDLFRTPKNRFVILGICIIFIIIHAMSLFIRPTCSLFDVLGCIFYVILYLRCILSAKKRDLYRNPALQHCELAYILKCRDHKIEITDENLRRVRRKKYYSYSMICFYVAVVLNVAFAIRIIANLA